MNTVETLRDCTCARGEEEWPHEVRFVVSMLAEKDSDRHDERNLPRFPYRIKAAIELQPAGAVDAFSIYTRDVNRQALGFVSKEALPVGSRALFFRDGTEQMHPAIACTVQRCRSFIDGWYEGAVRFDTEQPGFEP